MSKHKSPASALKVYRGWLITFSCEVKFLPIHWMHCATSVLAFDEGGELSPEGPWVLVRRTAAKHRVLRRFRELPVARGHAEKPIVRRVWYVDIGDFHYSASDVDTFPGEDVTHDFYMALYFDSKAILAPYPACLIIWDAPPSSRRFERLRKHLQGFYDLLEQGRRRSNRKGP